MELLAGASRHDPARLRQLLHPEFLEIGRSGRRWTRDEIIADLVAEGEREAPTVDEWEIAEMSPTLLLVTYRVTSPAGSSRHSSIWDITGNVPLLRFHQGTHVSPGTP